MTWMLCFACCNTHRMGGISHEYNTSPLPAPQDKPPRKAHQRRRQQSVVQYIAVLFAAAFVLMGMSYIMERRQNAQEVDTLKKQSTSAMQSVENLIQENEQLKRQVEELTQQLNENGSQPSADPGGVDPHPV